MGSSLRTKPQEAEFITSRNRALPSAATTIHSCHAFLNNICALISAALPLMERERMEQFEASARVSDNGERASGRASGGANGRESGRASCPVLTSRLLALWEALFSTTQELMVE